MIIRYTTNLNIEVLIWNVLIICILLSVIPYLERMVSQIYLTELQLYKAYLFDTNKTCFDLSISYGIVLSKIYDKRDDFDSNIVNL